MNEPIVKCGVTMMTKREVFDSKGVPCTIDTEIYPNYYLIACEFDHGGKVWFEGTNFNKKMLKFILDNCRVETFNGKKFDLPLILYTIFRDDWDEASLFQLAQALIDNQIRPWDLADERPYDHIDIIELAIGQSSLKTYAGRIHAPFMQDLPYAVGKILTKFEKDKVFSYCWNDVQNTRLLRQALAKQIELREAMSIQYSTDLRSKSDAQIAEAVLGRELEWRFGVKPRKPNVDPNLSFKYQCPDNISFKTPYMQEVLRTVLDADFRLGPTGKLIVPDEVKKLHIKLGETAYQFGGGGLHSKEKWEYRDAGNRFYIVDRDVTSYYPSIIIQQGLFPTHLTRAFLEVYKSILDRRVTAKKNKDKVTDGTLKIVLNGSFGKFGSVHSILFAPHLLIQVTVSGQLYLLMLIERLTLAGFNVLSGNTDGVVTQMDFEDKEKFNAIIEQWEKDTGLNTEETEYSKYCARDVNNYLAIKPDGSIKFKGVFAESGISKNPSGGIIAKALAAYFSRGVDIEDTVNASTDIRDFIFIRKVEGGCLNQDGEMVGKVVRWYQAQGEFFPLKYANGSGKVPSTDGARIFMDLTQPFPDDLDRDYYVRKAQEVVTNLTKVRPKQLDLFD